MSFGSVTSRGTVAKYLSEEEGRLCFLAFPFEVRIVNYGATFNATHLAGIVFLFRDTIGDYAAVGTGARAIHWRKLWMTILIGECHDTPQGSEDE
ncbi:MAG: hypothetical protein E8D50_01820 [Nitrospira sp.]|nr:MAG: hypothetical protein E8D50_01820 [Nitrospira sp.]